MNRVFAITTASERVSTGGDGRGEITFTVTNSSARPLRGQLRVRPLGSTNGEWLNIAGEAERSFSPNATQQVVVKVATPPGAPAGKYQFRLDAFSVINPDDDFTEGPTIDLEIKATEAPKKAFPWRLVAAVAGGVILTVGLTWWLWSKGADGTKVVFEDNFDEAPKGDWSQTKTETTPNGKEKFLGQFRTDSVKLALNNLPPHKTVTVNFDLYINNTWDGDDENLGPDEWGLKLDEGDILIHTSFSNISSCSGPNPCPTRTQQFACKNGEDTSNGCYARGEPATFGAAAINSLGYNAFPNLNSRDSVYKIKHTFAHDKSQLILNFFGNLKEKMADDNIGNEAWALDNVRIEVHSEELSELLPNDGTKVVFEDNFEESPKGVWSQRRTDMTRDGKSKFLGQFWTDSVKLALNDLPPHKIVTVSFDLYIYRSWDGDDRGDGDSPDIWGLIQGEAEFRNLTLSKEKFYGGTGPLLIQTTFSNREGLSQIFACGKGEYASPLCYMRAGKVAFGTGATAVTPLRTYPTVYGKFRDSFYKIKRTFAHDKSNLILNFFGELKERLEQNRIDTNEGWGLDNVRVEIQ